MSLTVERFSEFFHALHGHPPFPWQQRLLRCVVAGRWPDTLALPTASGKTACIDIALFALACGAPGSPRRIFFVVDRRVIVDEAFERAAGIAVALRQAQHGILADVAAALRGLSGTDDDPLAVFQLRGGLYRDDAWARTPTQPTVVCSTVDQIGSRLLFRSYGASPYARALHAGLAANDALILLDEAHCSNPFRQTLDAISRYRSWAEIAPPSPFAHVVLSATPAATAVPPFALNDDDRDHPVLARRIGARKPARLVETSAKTATPQFAKAVIEQVRALLEFGAKRIGIIVNRVASAKQVHALLGDALKVPVERRALFIGRMRPLDRDDLMRHWRPVFAAGSDIDVELPCFAVATQCLEVGANLDFDALVTECASLDALRQRFGRLFRLGEPGHVDPSEGPVAAVLMPTLSAKEIDPIYGEALPGTWAWLNGVAEAGAVDFGIDAIDGNLPKAAEARAAYLAEHRLLPVAIDAPVMLPAHVDCWVQTSPTPWPDPEPALFLRGVQRSSAEVQVCWRADLDGLAPESWLDRVAMVPPAAGECLSVPLHVLRRWIRGEAANTALADIDASEPDDEPAETSIHAPRAGLAWRGPSDSKAITADTLRELRPGDTLVLPGGLEGWEVFGDVLRDAAGNPVAVDRGDQANLLARGRAVLRLVPALLDAYPECDAREALRALIDECSEPESLASTELRAALTKCLLDLADALEALDDNASRRWTWLRLACRYLGDGRSGFELEQHAPAGLTLTSRRKLSRRERLSLQTGTPASEIGGEDDSASFTVPVALPDHLQGVATVASAFADGCMLPAAMRDDIALAASLHDLGKADPRFQAWLRGGLPFPVQPPYEALLAKSGGLANPLARRRARLRSGYPDGARHELLSVRLAESDPAVLSSANDRDLVLHLIASHHGRCRPFAPVIDDDQPLQITVEFAGSSLQAESDTHLERLDSGIAERFWTLVRRYGWWGLAYLEAIHILADHRRSEAEQREGGARS
jgi:CRISPR-associated endonuclease/helicase Cas3